MNFSTKTKPLSTCCEKLAKDNVMNPGKMFCTKCGEDCEVVMPKPKHSTLSTVRKPTGERALMIELWAKQGGRCAVTGERLLPPEHPMFHFQGSHGLNKGTYPEYRLDPRNLFMVTVEKHEEWHAFGDKSGLIAHDKRWEKVVRQVAILKAEAGRKHTHNA